MPEYWIVDPAERSVEVFRLRGDRYRPARWATDSGVVRAATLPRVQVRLENLFR